MKRILIIVVIFLLPSLASAAFLPGYVYRKTITIQASQVNEDLTNYPVYVKGSDLGVDFFSAVQADLDDVAFTSSDGTTLQPHELVWGSVASATAEIYFKATSISSTTDTTFYIYYGSSTAPANSTSSAWNSNYKGVFHLQNLNDSTVNAKNLTATGAVATTTAFLGNGYYFTQDQTPDQHLAAGASLGIGTNNFTIQAFASSNDVTADANGKIIVMNGDNGVSAGGSGLATIINSGTSWGALDGNVAWRSASDSLVGDTWYSLALVCDAGTYRFYKNGVQIATGTCNPQNEGASFNIGNGEDDYVQDYFGKADEVRGVAAVLTPGWLSSEYNNLSSPATFYATGTQESTSASAGSQMKIIWWYE